MAFNWFRRKFIDGSQSTPDSQPTPESTSDAPEQPPTESQSEPPPAEPLTKSQADYLAWAKAAYKNIQQRQTEQTEAETSFPIAEIAAVTAAEVASEEPIPSEPLSTTEPPEAVVTEPEPEASPLEVSEPEGTEAANESTIPETEATIPEPEVTESEVTESTTEAEATVTDVAPPIATELVDHPPDSPSLTSEPAAIEPHSPEPAPTEPAPLPFWARAEAERLERLERLKAEAIETETPATEMAVQPEMASSAPPVTQEVESSAGTAAVPNLDFDEGFLWSAEVLAAQGRRPEDISVEEITWLQKLRRGLGKTRRGLVNQLKAIVGQGPLNQDAVLEIESLLLQADVGVAATDRIIQALQDKMRQETLPPDGAIAYLKQILRGILDQPLQQGYSPTFAPEKNQLNIWLMAGVNGVGKTTTIGKIAHVATTSGYKCLIGAADTFRAAAVEQVKIWGERSQVEVIANPGKNTDPAAVVFDAITAAQAREVELLLVDTAGRLQNKQNLMEELRKIRRIIDKKATNAQVEALLVLDATLGQNGLRQAQVFAEAAQLTGVVITKLDGTAKGGVALAVVQELGLPIRFIGAGEGITDLRPFSSYEFVEALLSS
uniref:Signal recognition particle receptor FtsY n=1 Tax=Cyanothece sp. (strain PCC 7425 / ATCC 29141) TaxID=395961 RepID=B8HWA3_CYAP4